PPPHANCLRATPSGNWHTAQKSGQFENHESGQIQKLVTGAQRAGEGGRFSSALSLAFPFRRRNRKIICARFSRRSAFLA
ncbi:MAG: hypothetical protein LBO00_05725, partial [Zoogloeaceae bacterium]|nr:hypothetical protein [Zoogloeaceae bacterium]